MHTYFLSIALPAFIVGSLLARISYEVASTMAKDFATAWLRSADAVFNPPRDRIMHSSKQRCGRGFNRFHNVFTAAIMEAFLQFVSDVPSDII